MMQRGEGLGSGASAERTGGAPKTRDFMRVTKPEDFEGAVLSVGVPAIAIGIHLNTANNRYNVDSEEQIPQARSALFVHGLQSVVIRKREDQEATSS